MSQHRTLHTDTPHVTADDKHYADAAMTTPGIQTSLHTRHRLLVHRLSSLRILLLVVNTRHSKQLVRSVLSSQHYYMKPTYNETHCLYWNNKPTTRPVTVIMCISLRRQVYLSHLYQSHSLDHIVYLDIYFFVSLSLTVDIINYLTVQS